MEKYLSVLETCPLFQNIASRDIPGLLTCLGASLRTYRKQQHILSEGDSCLGKALPAPGWKVCPSA